LNSDLILNSTVDSEGKYNTIIFDRGTSADYNLYMYVNTYGALDFGYTTWSTKFPIMTLGLSNYVK
jgi:hypothetical protein